MKKLALLLTVATFAITSCNETAPATEETVVETPVVETPAADTTAPAEAVVADTTAPAAH
jgi:hypothetical protein